MTTPTSRPADRDLPRLAFFVLGAAFFGLAILDRVLALRFGFSTLRLTIFLAWLLAFLIAPWSRASCTGCISGAGSRSPLPTAR